MPLNIMYTIQQGTPADAATIIDLAERIWWPTYSPILPKEQIRFMLETIYSIDNISHQLRTGSQTYLLLLEDGKPVAFAAYSQREESPEVYKLHKLYCLPETQGKGYGKALIDEVIKRTLQAGIYTLDLNVNIHNKAKSFYEKMGFSVACEEDIPIGNYWMNDYVMRKELKGEQ